jgi:O-6-methylguanine DNA methyltransferase
MRCESALIRLDELRTGELDLVEAEAVRRHLEVCGYCEYLYHEIGGIAERSRSLLGECPSSCAHTLERQLFDRCGKTSAGGLDLWVAYSEQGLTRIAPMAQRSFEQLAWEYARRFGKELRGASLPEPLERQVHAAATGHGEGGAEVDLSRLPDFERRVLEVLARIPAGEVRSYAWVAREAGRPRALRAVGNACARNPVPVVVPCHRVVPAAGGLGGYAWGAGMKRELLAREGVDVERVEELEHEHAKYVRVGEWYCFPTCRSLRDLSRDQIALVHDEREAFERGLKPCGDCRPLEPSA